MQKIAQGMADESYEGPHELDEVSRRETSSKRRSDTSKKATIELEQKPVPDLRMQVQVMVRLLPQVYIKRQRTRAKTLVMMPSKTLPVYVTVFKIPEGQRLMVYDLTSRKRLKVPYKCVESSFNKLQETEVDTFCHIASVMSGTTPRTAVVQYVASKVNRNASVTCLSALAIASVSRDA